MLGDDQLVLGMGLVGEFLDGFLVLGAARQVVHELGMNLQVVRRQVGQDLERVAAGAEVVQRELALHLVQRLDEGLALLEVADGGLLLDLEHEALRRYAVGLDLLADPAGDLAVLQAAGSELDEEDELSALLAQLGQATDAVEDHPAVQRHGDAAALGAVEEFAGRDLVALLVHHAHQHLVAFARVAVQADDGLEQQLEAVVRQRVLDALAPGLVELALGHLALLRAIDDGAVAALLACLGIGAPGPRQDLVGVEFVVVDDGGADAGRGGDGLALDVEDVAGDGLAQTVHVGLQGFFLPDRYQAGEGIALEAGYETLLAAEVHQQAACLHQQCVSGGDAQLLTQLVEAVDLQVQQAETLLGLGGRGDGLAQAIHEIGPVVEPGEHVALLEFLDLLLQLLVVGRAADHHLGAGFALDAGRAELELGLERLAFLRLQGQIQGLVRFLAASVFAQEFLESILVRGGHQVEDRHALEVVPVVVAEQLQIGLVGIDMHAVGDVGDGVLGAVEQGLAAAVRLLQGLLQLAHAVVIGLAPRAALQHQPQVGLVVLGHHICGPLFHAGDDIGVARAVQRDDGHLPGLKLHQLGQLLQGDAGAAQGVEDEVRMVLRQQLGYVLLVLGAFRTGGISGAARDRDQALVVVGHFLDDEQSQALVHVRSVCMSVAARRGGMPLTMP